MPLKRRPRKFKSAAALLEAWEEYKADCDGKTVITTEFCQKTGQFVTAEVPHPISYTIKGFCVFTGLSERGFYDLYDKDEKLQSVVSQMKLECEHNVRSLFENGTINSRLAGLWMSNYGYSTTAKVEADIKPVVISGDDALED